MVLQQLNSGIGGFVIWTRQKKAAKEAGIIISGFNGDADYSLVDPNHKKLYLEDLKKSIETVQKLMHGV